MISRSFCQALWGLAALAALSACADTAEDSGFPAETAQGFVGAIAADEPNAALIGRDILRAGGNAADASAALYFALSVTYPSNASLGGGGFCLVFDPETGAAEALAFHATLPAGEDAEASRPSAIPGNVRGIAALHARYGRMRWEQVIVPAETLARFGMPVSRALAYDLHRVGEPLLADPEFRAIFGRLDADGLLREGEMLEQPDLANTLSEIRTRSAGAFYNGDFARIFVEAANRAGAGLDLHDLASYEPAWRETVRLSARGATIHTTPPPAQGGITALAMWHMLAAGDRYLNTPVMERPHLLAEITMRAFADRTAWRDSAEGANAADAVLAADRLDQLIGSYRSDAHTPPDSLDPAPEARSENPAATSFAVVDGEGMAVVCLFTMHNLFGTARVAPGTGIVLAAAPSPEGRGPTSLAALLMVEEGSNDVILVAGAGGGTAAPSALISVILGTVFETKPLEMAMNRVRLQHGGSPDVLVIEPGFHQAVIDGLARRGHRLLETPNLGRVNAIYCPGGLSANPGGCGASTDIRGFGLAVRD